jgi:hypothetical protein
LSRNFRLTSLCKASDNGRERRAFFDNLNFGLTVASQLEPVRLPNRTFGRELTAQCWQDGSRAVDA